MNNEQKPVIYGVFHRNANRYKFCKKYKFRDFPNEELKIREEKNIEVNDLQRKFMSNKSIGLSELIEKVKADLLTPPKDKTAPFLFVDSVELELKVIVEKDAKTGLEVNVVGIGGANIGADVGQTNEQTIKVTLSPLFTKEEMKEYYKAFRPEDVLPSINKSLEGTILGNETGEEEVM